MSLALLADLAQILAETFLEPDADLKEGLEQLLEGGPEPALAEPLGRMIQHSLSREDQPVAYAQLFLHAKNSDVVHLFESVQARGHHMAPEVLGPLQAIYEAADITLQEDITTPPDHLGLELACLSYLLGAVIEGDLAEQASNRDLALRLIREHLRPFLAQVAEQLPQVPAPPYYQAASDLATALLVESDKALAEIKPTTC